MFGWLKAWMGRGRRAPDGAAHDSGAQGNDNLGYVFVSYTGGDREEVQRVLEQARRRDIELWFDQDSLDPDYTPSELTPTIVKAIEDASAALVFTSESLIGRQSYAFFEHNQLIQANKESGLPLYLVDLGGETLPEIALYLAFEPLSPVDLSNLERVMCALEQAVRTPREQRRGPPRLSDPFGGAVAVPLRVVAQLDVLGEETCELVVSSGGTHSEVWEAFNRINPIWNVRRDLDRAAYLGVRILDGVLEHVEHDHAFSWALGLHGVLGEQRQYQDYMTAIINPLGPEALSALRSGETGYVGSGLAHGSTGRVVAFMLRPEGAEVLGPQVLNEHIEAGYQAALQATDGEVSGIALFDVRLTSLEHPIPSECVVSEEPSDVCWREIKAEVALMLGLPRRGSNADEAFGQRIQGVPDTVVEAAQSLLNQTSSQEAPDSRGWLNSLALSEACIYRADDSPGTWHIDLSGGPPMSIGREASMHAEAGQSLLNNLMGLVSGDPPLRHLLPFCEHAFRSDGPTATLVGQLMGQLVAAQYMGTAVSGPVHLVILDLPCFIVVTGVSGGEREIRNAFPDYGRFITAVRGQDNPLIQGAAYQAAMHLIFGVGRSMITEIAVQSLPGRSSFPCLWPGIMGEA